MGTGHLLPQILPLPFIYVLAPLSLKIIISYNMQIITSCVYI